MKPDHLASLIAGAVGGVCACEVTPTSVVATGTNVTEGNRATIQGAVDGYVFDPDWGIPPAAEWDPGVGQHLDEDHGTQVPHAHPFTDISGVAVDGQIPAAIARDSEIGHPHPNDHARVHVVTAAADHTFPGGTSTFLRADGTFATPAGGGGGVVKVVKSADQASTVITLADVTDLLLPVAAGGAYVFEFVVFFTAAAATTGIGLALNGPAAPTFLRAGLEVPTSTTARFNSLITAYESALVATASAGTTALMAIMKGHLLNGSNAGNLQLRFRSEIAASAVTILRGSYGILL